MTSEQKKYMSNFSRCELCGSPKKLELHHIIPIVYGGPDIIDNWIAICYGCHAKLTPRNLLISKGIEISGAAIKISKARTGKTYETPKAKQCKADIRRLSRDFDGCLSDTDVIKYLGIARGSFYKYKNQLRMAAQ